MRQLSVRIEQWPLHEPFIISRLPPFLQADVVVVEISEQGVTGRGECERSDIYEADYPPILPLIESVRSAIEQGANQDDLLSLLPPGCARNALDCALWDLQSRLAQRPVWQLLGQTAPPGPVTSVFTLSLRSAQEMGEAARLQAWRPLLKLKLGQADGDLERVAAVRANAPDTRLVVDANTGWSREQLVAYLPRLQALGVELIEQPFPVGQDHWLEGIDRLVPIAADESCLTRDSLPQLVNRYDVVNIKLDKSGGLTEAMALAKAARDLGFEIMVGCNIGTSLAMTPALLLAQQARFVDLDGPLLLSRDHDHALRYEGNTLYPPEGELWGY